MAHPDHTDLAAWAKGELSAKRSEQIESHLRDCRQCDETAKSFRKPRLTQTKRTPADPSAFEMAETSEFTLAPQGTRTVLPTIASEQTVETGFAKSGDGKEDLPSVERLKAHQTRPYEISGSIASGGMGSVLDAGDVSLRRRVAMKVIQDRQASHRHVARFIEEAQITGQLEHPSIVPVHELGVNASGDVYYTMKLIQGQSLSQIIKAIRDGDTEACREFPMSRLLDIFSRVCDAMEFAHSKHVIHRDLKPANIMVGQYGEVLVVDWGLAKVVAPDPTTQESLHRDSDPTQQPASPLIETDRDHQNKQLFTMDGTVVGTPAFMSPEQALGQLDDVDHRTDIYALGAVLYNILTFRPPVNADDVSELMQRVRAGRIDQPDPALVPTNWIPEPVLLVARKALSLNADQRYASVGDLSDEINAYRGGYATRAENAGYFRQLRLLATRNRGITWSVGIAALLLLASSMMYVTNLAAEKQRADNAAQQAVKAAAKAASAEQVAVREKAAAELALGRSQTSLAEAAFLNKDRQAMERYLDQCPPDARDTHWNYLRDHANETIWKLYSNKINDTCFRGLAADPRDSPSSGSGVARFYSCDGLGLLRCFDGYTGKVLREKQTPLVQCEMAISNDGTRLAFATRENSFRLSVVSTDDFSMIATHSSSDFMNCRSISFSSDRNLVACSNYDKSILINIDDGTTRVVSDGCITCCHPQEMEAFGFYKGRVVRVNLAQAKVDRVYRGDHPDGAMVSVSRSGKLLAAVGPGGTLVIYRVENQDPLKKITAYEDVLMNLQFSRHSDLLMTYGIDSRLGILQCWNPLSKHNVPIREFLTIGSRTGNLLAWNQSVDVVASGLAEFEGFATPVFSKPVRDGGGNVKFVDESTIGHRVWRNKPGLSFYDLVEKQEIDRQPKGRVIRSRSRTTAVSGFLGFWERPQQTYSFVVERGENVIGNPTMPSIETAAGFDAAAISDDGRFAAFAGSRRLRILRRDSDNPSASWQTVVTRPDSEFPYPMPPNCSRLFFPSTAKPSLFFSVLTHELGNWRMMLLSFDLESGEQTREKIHILEGNVLEIEPSGKRVFCGCSDGTIRGFDPFSLEETFHTRVHDRSVTGIAIRLDGQVLATTGQRGLVRFWELTDSGVGKLLRESACAGGRVEAMDFSPSGTELVCSTGEKISLLDVSDLLPRTSLNDVPAPGIVQTKPIPPKSEQPIEPSRRTSSPERETGVSGLEIAARLKSGQWHWSKPVELEFDGDIDPGDHLDPVISRDGQHLYLTLWNDNRGLDVRRFDFLDSRFQKLTGGTWLTGGINSSRRDYTSSPPAKDGTMVFTSDRARGIGGLDLWVCSSMSPETHFSPATPLAVPINSQHDEADACLTADGLGIVFVSNRPAPTIQNNAGQPEIWWAYRDAISDEFSPPRIVGLIGDRDDGETVSVTTPHMTADGLLLIYAANQSDGTKDLYYRSRQSTDEDFGKRTRLSNRIQSPRDDMMPSLSSDGRTLIFGSRLGTGNKRLRLFVTHLSRGHGQDLPLPPN